MGNNLTWRSLRHSSDITQIQKALTRKSPDMISTDALQFRQAIPKMHDNNSNQNFSISHHNLLHTHTQTSGTIRFGHTNTNKQFQKQHHAKRSPSKVAQTINKIWIWQELYNIKWTSTSYISGDILTSGEAIHPKWIKWSFYALIRSGPT